MNISILIICKKCRSRQETELKKKIQDVP